MNRIKQKIFWLSGALWLLMFSFAHTKAQTPFPSYPDSLFSLYYHQKVSQFEQMPFQENEIIFLGNSITDFGRWTEIFTDPKVINRGISGDVTAGVLNRLQEVVERKPAKLFLMIGTNDLARGIGKDSVLKNIFRIVELVQEYTPATKLFVQSIFPVNEKPGKYLSHAKNGKVIDEINDVLQQQAESGVYIYIDVATHLKNTEGKLNLDYSNEGLHLMGEGYLLWKHIIYPYVYDLQDKPSLLPRPQQIEWTGDRFPLFKLVHLVFQEDSLKDVAHWVQHLFVEKGLRKPSLHPADSSGPSIELNLQKMEGASHPKEAYSLEVNKDKISISAESRHGLFNGIQTLRQLMRDGVFVNGVEIRDDPAFSWRGYMIDVGRNYQSMKQIKEQLDVMAHYKMNRFHFHLTENVAWRLQIQGHPELTSQEFMTRNKGQYYTIEEVKELIRYAKERFITFIPEIDMPGHSEAFKRATGADMQSEEGMQVLKEILAEMDSTYTDLPYFHIGADEVQFTNENFIPTMVDMLHGQGKQTIGWAPGGNYDDRTIHQLWQSQSPEKKSESGRTLRYIDSRAFYLNHKDPLSGVISFFNRKIGDVEREDEHILGGEICLWNDIRAKEEKDILDMNFAYPAILTMAERTWAGGGYEGVLTDPGEENEERFQAFKEFETRLLDQKTQFFKERSFPYARQSDIQWQLFGPFENEGELDRIFWPERTENISDSTADLVRNGGTVWLKHFFAPVIAGAIDAPEPNTTWYAYREIYSPVDTIGHFWIGFNNPSRSYAPTTPERGKWDDRESKVWMNGKPVLPPPWTYPGRMGSQEEPLVDESYEYRKPTEIPLKKGKNSILIKAPVGTFQGKSWQHPVKWMFYAGEPG